MQTRTLALAAALALAVSAPRAAHALTLADLDAGAVLSVGALTFSDFDVTPAGDVSLDLADYPVQLLADGFRIAGPLSALLGEAGTLLISYVVEAAGPVIAGASVFAPLVAEGDGSVAWVSESLLADGEPLGSLFVLRVGGGGAPDLVDAATFAPVSRVEVAKVLAIEGGIFAAIPQVDQRFVVVPEPLSLALLLLGLAGLALSGSRRLRMRTA